MFTSIIWLCVWALFLGIVVVVIGWVLQEAFGIVIPPRIMKMIGMIFALIFILLVIQVAVGGLAVPRLLTILPGG